MENQYLPVSNTLAYTNVIIIYTLLYLITAIIITHLFEWKIDIYQYKTH
jgi:hypothetical protein